MYRIYHQLCYSLRHYGSDTLRVAMETDLMYIHMVTGYSKHCQVVLCSFISVHISDVSVHRLYKSY